MILELQLLRKEGPPRIFPIPELPVVVGRGESATVRVRHKSISREHVRIFEREGRLHVADLNSSNGTFVNDRRVTLSAVEPGDEIRLGTVVLRLSALEEEAGREPVVIPEASPAEKPAVDAVDELVLPGTVEGAGDEDREGAGTGPPPSAPARSPRPVRPGGPGFPEARKPSMADGPGGIRVRERILQFNRQDPRKGRSFLRDDFSQYGGLSRLLLVLLFLALAAGGFFLFRWFGEEVTPSGSGSGGLEGREEPGRGESNPEGDLAGDAEDG